MSFALNSTKAKGTPAIAFLIWDLMFLIDPQWTPSGSFASRVDLSFKQKDLQKIFTDSSLQLTSASLEIQVAGRQHAEGVRTLELDVNGIRTFGLGMPVHLQGNQYSVDLSQVRLNGAESFTDALKRITIQGGQLALSARGQTLKIAKATLILRGNTGVICPPRDPESTPTPVPSPTPLPVPKTSISQANPSDAVTGSSSMRVEFTGDQPGLRFECTLDAGTPELCVSPAIYSDLQSGPHRVRIIAVNASGVRDPVGAEYDWTVDLDPPQVTIAQTGLDAVTRSSERQYAFSSSEPGTFQCSLDGAAFSSCVSPVSYLGLTEGIHRFEVRAIDSHANVSAAAHDEWSVDLTAPVSSFASIAPSDPVTHATQMTLAFAASESAQFECRHNNGGFAPCVSPVSLSGLADGGQSFDIRATDIAGNFGPIATYTWTVDTAKPVLQLTRAVPAEGLTSSSSVSAEFVSNEASQFQCSLDGQPWSACSSPFSASALSDGNHELRVIATDLADNSSAPLVVAWAMDHTLPTLAWGEMQPSAAGRINSASFRASLSASEPVTLSCSLNGSAINQPSSPVSLSNLREGSYQLAVSGRDAAGNLSNLLTHSFVVDLTAPIASVSGAVGTPTSQNSNTLVFSANETSSFECSLDHAGFSLCVSAMAVSGLADGDHLFEVRPTDVAGNVGAIVSTTWKVDTTAPLVTAITVIVGRTSATINWTTNEPTTSRVNWGPGTTTPNSTTENSQLVTDHSVVVTGLTASTIYTIQATGRDEAGNSYISAKKQFRTSQ